MNRRQFLQALAYVGATGALAIELVERDLELPPGQRTLKVPAGSWGLLQSVHVYANEERSRPVNFGLRRDGASHNLFSWPLNALGGIIYYHAVPGGEIGVTNDHKIHIVHDFDGACETVTAVNGDLRHDYFILRRPLPGSPDELIEHPDAHTSSRFT